MPRSSSLVIPYSLLAALLLGGGAAAQDVIISEFAALNSDGIVDEDGDHSDWIELNNRGTSPADLEGWYLTDDAGYLPMWRLPSLTLEPGGFAVIFASGKDRSAAGSELHTNFCLEGEGEFLALVGEDGRTIVHSFSPAFLPQAENVTFGIVEDAEAVALVPQGAPAKVLVPSDGTLGGAWLLPGFDDSSWLAGAAAVGYDTVGGVDPGVPGTNLARGGTATQSTTAYGGVASRAIDGNRSGVYGDGSITHTDDVPGSWWRVDLGRMYTIDRVVLWNRTDCCAERLTKLRVSILDDASEVVEQSEHFLDGGNPSTQDYTIVLPTVTRGRYVEIRKLGPDVNGTNYLSLAEVEIIQGLAGFGYAIETDIQDAMLGIRATAYLRVPFSVADPAAHEFLDLDMQYDDGFVAYINGREVARRNAPADPAWDSKAPSARPIPDTLVFERIRAANEDGLLQAGGNVLAIQGLNADPNDVDFLILPILSGVSVRGDAIRYFLEPTPGSPNAGETVIGFVADTKFSVDRGFYDTPFDVEIMTPTPGAEIRYTLDGEAPTETTGRRYTGPIRIAGTTILRAAAFKDGFGPTDVDTQTYIFLDDVIASSVMSKTITRDPVYGPQMRAALTDLPSISLVTKGGINKTVEVPISFEWIPSDNARGIHENAGVRYYGGDWTNFDKKNFRLYFRSIYGARKLEFPLFEGHDRGIPAVERFDQIELRAGSHDMSQRGFYMSNRFTDDTMLDMGNLNPHGRFVHLYLNGTYWGQYHLRERWNASMLAEYLGGDKDDYEAINGNWNVGGWPDPGVPYDGDGSAWTRIKSLRDDYEAVKPYLDVRHYVDYMLMFMFGNSEDEYRCVGPTAPGSGFKFFLNDADGFTRDAGNRTSMGQPGRQNGDGPGSIFSMLLAEHHPDYMTLLSDRIYRLFFGDGAMTPAKNTERLLERCDEVKRAFIAESARWGYRTPASWEQAKNAYVGGVLPSRTQTVIGQYRVAGFYSGMEAPAFSHPGGLVDEGLVVAPSVSTGTLYYTLDGTDPRFPGGAINPASFEGGAVAWTAILAADAEVRVLVPQDGSLGLAWTGVDFDDSLWKSGVNGVGFEMSSGYEDEIRTDVGAEAFRNNPSVYIRIRFDVPEPSALGALALRVKYDDGFVAFLNGERIAAANAPEPQALAWDSAATASHADSRAVVFERIDIPDAGRWLRTGANVLAVQALNTSKAEADLLFTVEVVAAEATGEGIIRVEGPLRLLARAKVGDAWSPLEEAFYYLDIPLRITEVMYHPRDPEEGSDFGDDDFEFLEFQNVGSETLDLAGFHLSGAVAYDFSLGNRWIPPGAVFVVVRDLEAFLDRYPLSDVEIDGEYAGRLGNAGERIRLTGPAGEPILEFRYRDTWLPQTDGEGYSLVIDDSLGDRETWGEADRWLPSPDVDGSPGIVEGWTPPRGGWQIPGDLDQDGNHTIADAIALLDRLFGASPRPLPCTGATIDDGGNKILADFDASGQLDLGDAIGLLSYLFASGPPPALGTACIQIEGCPDVCVP
ncbi:MAG: lamin tail domain-containing protein [Planctomycetes bacterium]|nr:lamin tail domain-containing protein [Planctomycetota bacterium]